jgi:histidyl-tRNA synthetase
VESKHYFEKVKTYLDMMDIPYTVDQNLVRGLDYYNHTAFEIMSEAEGFGAITTLCGGGRYNGLTEELGGPNTPGIGFGMGMERLLMALDAEKIELPVVDSLDCFFIAVGEEAEKETVRLIHKMRLAGIQADKDYQERKVKGQFKAADRLHAKYVLILGDDELAKGIVNVKTMETGEQTEVLIGDLPGVMQQLLGGKGNE